MLFVGEVVLALSVMLLGLLFWRRKRRPDYALTAEEARREIRAGRTQVRQMRHVAIRIPERAMRQQIAALADTAGLILDVLEQDPTKIRRARRFLDYYLGTAVSLIQRYARLGEHRGANPEIEAAVARFAELIPALQAAFAEQHTLLLRDEAFEFQVDADVMQKIMDLDGM
ncbi:MAG: 5-bromo-4-chloroindolyl phosphate hydrolysis family protein [Anaerolineales bacterium]